MHLSPGDQLPWRLPELQRLCLGIVTFETAFEMLMPEHRRGNNYCWSHSLRTPTTSRRTSAAGQSPRPPMCQR